MRAAHGLGLFDYGWGFVREGLSSAGEAPGFIAAQGLCGGIELMVVQGLNGSALTEAEFELEDWLNCIWPAVIGLSVCPPK